MAEASRQAAERATRRQFFRLFGRQTFDSAGSVLAGVAALRATGQEALDELLTSARPSNAGDQSTVVLRPADDPPRLPATDALRSPYRVEGDELHVLDQRALPERVVMLRCRDATDVAAAVRVGAAGAGPVLGQIAAYALAIVAASVADRPAWARTAAVSAAADTLRAARPASRAIGGAIERALAAADEAGGDPAAIRREADMIAMEAALDHARLGQLAATELARIEPANATPAGRTLALLVHGDLGPLAGGMVGPGFALIQSLAKLDRPAHAWLTDGAPLMEGARAAWQLDRLDVPHTTIADAAAGWLLRHRHIDAVLIRLDWVAANGDAVAPLGSADIARRSRAEGVPVYGLAPTALLDPLTLDGSALPSDQLLPPDVAGSARLDPAGETVAGDLLDAILTEEGRISAPYSRSVGRAVAARAARREADAQLAEAG